LLSRFALDREESDGFDFSLMVRGALLGLGLNPSNHFVASQFLHLFPL
jgi:hypothetical protein